MGNSIGTSFAPIKRRVRFKLTSRSSTTSLATNSSADTGKGSAKGSLNTDGLNDGISKILDPDNLELVDHCHIIHYMLKTSWNGNFSAPVAEALESGITVLDVGCGPGTWILDMSSTYLKSNFFGIDISPAYPTQIKPVNAQFITADILQGLPFGDNFFDFVYIRFLNKAFTKEEWYGGLLDELIRITKPGGWIEMMEQSVILGDPSPHLMRIWDAGKTLLEDRGVWVELAHELEDLLNSHPQTVKVTKEELDHPIGAWGGKNGGLWANHLIQALEDAKPSLMDFIPMSIEEFEKFAKEYAEQLRDPKYKSSTATCRAYCQKVG